MSKAKVGDHIIIAMPHSQRDPYVVGDVFEVLETCEEDCVTAFHEDYGVVEIFDHEYYIPNSGAEKQVDAVNPQHYKKFRVEVIDIIEDAVQGANPFEAVNQANVLKYVLRYRNKNGVEDLKKAKWYLEKLIEHLDE